jgi:hypothetical protein
MNEIFNKIVKKNNKNDISFNQFELELQLKIEIEKTKQLELIKDIKKIEKSIKQKELYSKRNKIYCSNHNHSEDESNLDSDLDSDLESDLDPDLDSSNNSESNNDTLSMCSSIDSDIEINDLQEVEITYLSR